MADFNKYRVDHSYRLWLATPLAKDENNGYNVKGVMMNELQTTFFFYSGPCPRHGDIIWSDTGRIWSDAGRIWLDGLTRSPLGITSTWLKAYSRFTTCKQKTTNYLLINHGPEKTHRFLNFLYNFHRAHMNTGVTLDWVDLRAKDHG